MINSSNYLETLSLWINSSRKDIYIPPDRPDLACYGTGYNSWGVQTNQKAFSAYAVFAMEKLNEEILELALRMFRYSLESHVEGSYKCSDNTKWGHTWISALGIERMMHGVEAIKEHLTDYDKELLNKVLISESDRLMFCDYDMVSNPVAATGRNKPESNLWNGAILHRTAMMYPDCPRAEQYREKGTEFLINSISVPSDATNEKIVDAQTVAQRYLGANFFESYALNHHNYLNVGYMVICLSNIAMLHFSYKQKHLTAPESLYHHVTDLWKLIKLCTFPDGRLNRIGGDGRVRYCYCQDYAIPMWLLMLDKYGETDCLDFEQGWLEIVKKEVASNGNGSFLGERTLMLKKASPLYYTRLESDRAATFAMGAYWRKIFDEFLDVKGRDDQADNFGAWHDDFHGACFHKTKKRAVSWVWKSSEKPQGLCLPTDKSDIAEWKENLAGKIIGTGHRNISEIISHRESFFDGGFVTTGTFYMESLEQMEGSGENIMANQKIAFAALPDETTAICFQYAKALYRVYINVIKGLMLHIPNDIFNEKIRTYYTCEKSLHLKGCPGEKELILLNSNWVNIDDCLSVQALYGGNLSIFRPARRQIGIKRQERTEGMLYADEICCPYIEGQKYYNSGETIIDTGFIIQAGMNHTETRKTTTRHTMLNEDIPNDVRAAIITGADGERYLFVANFGDANADIKLNIGETCEIEDLTCNKKLTCEKALVLNCEKDDARLFKIGNVN